jgi:HK97 family phage prohead protease
VKTRPQQFKTQAGRRYFFDCPFDVKALDANDGTFKGYAAIFGNVDLGGDIIMPGAFKELVQNEDGKIAILWQHDQHQPIGVAEVGQDEKGLSVAGELVLDDPIARKAYAHLKAKSVRAMSIGFDVLEGGAKYLADGVRQLSNLKLWEVSVVTFGMNPLARVAGVKSALDCRSIREFEDLARDALVLPRRQAKRLAAAAWPSLDRDDRGEPAMEELAPFAQELRSLIDYMKAQK